MAGGGEISSTLTLEPARKVAGRFVFEGRAKPPAPKGIQINLAPLDSDHGPAGVDVNDDWTFELPNVPPGRYLAFVGGIHAPWAVASPWRK